MDPDGTGSGREVLATHYEGKELNSPNDVIVHSTGAIYFSDPTYGRMPVFGIEREQDLDFQGVYRLAPEGGDPQLLVDDFVQPNGLCFSPDESLLYINDTDRAHIRVFDVGGDGTISNGRVLADGIGTGDLESGELVDGMKCDEHGNVWVTGPKGVWVFSPKASISASSRSPRTSATSTGAARTGAGCSYRRRHPSTGSKPRHAAAASRS
jgi:gluconolactonase